MAKKKEKRTDEEKANIEKIYRDSFTIEELANRMYKSGEGVSITKIYHNIKERLKLPGYYVFAYGDAIKDVLKEAGWIRE
jgi:hypothetical protein